MDCTLLTVFQVLLCITNNPIKLQSFAYTLLNDQTVLFQTFHFSISTQFKCHKFYLTQSRTLLGASTPDLSRPWSNDNEGVLRIPGASPSDCFVSYLGQSLWKCKPSAEMQSADSLPQPTGLSIVWGFFCGMEF